MRFLLLVVFFYDLDGKMNVKKIFLVVFLPVLGLCLCCHSWRRSIWTLY